MLSENNGVVDGPSTDVQEHQLMSSSYQLLLQILNTTFSWWGRQAPLASISQNKSENYNTWAVGLLQRCSLSAAAVQFFPWHVFMRGRVFVRSGFSQPGQRSLLKKALGVLAGRLKEGGAELTLEQLVKWGLHCIDKICFNVYIFTNFIQLLEWPCRLYRI